MVAGIIKTAFARLDSNAILHVTNGWRYLGIPVASCEHMTSSVSRDYNSWRVLFRVMTFSFNCDKPEGRKNDQATSGVAFVLAKQLMDLMRTRHRPII